MMNNFFQMLVDTDFLNNYKYVSKEEFLLFIKIHVKKILKQIEILNLTDMEYSSLNNIEQDIYNVLYSSINLYNRVIENEIIQNDIESVLYELVKREVFKDSIDNIIVLEEIEYLKIDNIMDKLKNVYFYLVELEIYNYYSIEKIKWKNENQKQYVFNRIKHSILLQKEVKHDFIQNGSLSKENLYLYNKTIGIISTYPIKHIMVNYNENVLTDIYKIKYLLTLDDKLKEYTENKLLEEKNNVLLTEKNTVSNELKDKYKKLIIKKDCSISSLKQENILLKKENEIKQNKIDTYVGCINEYNNLSFVKKLIKILKKDNIKLLN